MSLSIAAVVAGSLSLMSAIGLVVGWQSHGAQSKQKWASQVWRDVTHRNGVGELSPFHPADASFNAPGMVQVFPSSRVAERPVHRWEVEQVSAVSQRGTSDKQEVSQNLGDHRFGTGEQPSAKPVKPNVSELETIAQAVFQNSEVSSIDTSEDLPVEPMALSDPPHEAERARVRRLYQQGFSQTKLIKAVWGLSKGGGKSYTEARRRFRAHVADIATGELRASIQAEGAATHA